MILGSLQNSERVEKLYPAFKKILSFIKTHNCAELPTGRIELDGEKVFLNVDDATLRKQDEQVLEVHRKYIDIHFPITDDEIVGWRDLASINVDSLAPFDTEKDFAFYPQAAKTYFTVQPGEFYIMFPEDAHAPIIGEGYLRKIVAKVMVSRC